MLHEKYLPDADVSSHHEITVDADISIVFPLIENLDFTKSKIIYWLFKLRGLPVPESMTLKGIEKLHFIKLETIANQELILGLIGQFWKLNGNMQKFESRDFKSFNDPHFAKATWNLEAVPLAKNRTIVKTETRVFCPGSQEKKKFRMYWRFVKPFSGLTRQEMLKAIKKKAESNSKTLKV